MSARRHAERTHFLLLNPRVTPLRVYQGCNKVLWGFRLSTKKRPGLYIKTGPVAKNGPGKHQTA